MKEIIMRSLRPFNRKPSKHSMDLENSILNSSVMPILGMVSDNNKDFIDELFKK